MRERFGRNPWLCSENVGSHLRCRTCMTACWINADQHRRDVQAFAPARPASDSTPIARLWLVGPRNSCPRMEAMLLRWPEISDLHSRRFPDFLCSL